MRNHEKEKLKGFRGFLDENQQLKDFWCVFLSDQLKSPVDPQLHLDTSLD